MVTAGIAGRGGAHGVAIQANGKIVAVGVDYEPKSHTAGFAVARCEPDGALDTTFGTHGQVLTELRGGAAAFHVVLEPDGTIVAAGGSDFSGSPAFTLVRYRKNGRIDPAFGQNGILTSKLLDPFAAIAIQPDGGIVAAGSGFAVVRFDADGTLDDSFGETWRGDNELRFERRGTGRGRDRDPSGWEHRRGRLRRPLDERHRLCSRAVCAGVMPSIGVLASRRRRALRF